MPLGQQLELIESYLCFLKKLIIWTFKITSCTVQLRKCKYPRRLNSLVKWIFMPLHLLKLLFVFYLRCFACTHVHLRVSDVLKQDFLTVVSCHLGAGHLNLSPARAAISPVPFHYIFKISPNLQAEVSDGCSLSRKLMMVLDYT